MLNRANMFKHVERFKAVTNVPTNCILFFTLIRRNDLYSSTYIHKVRPGKHIIRSIPARHLSLPA